MLKHKMMEKVTRDDTTISEASGIFNKLPSWLVEMTDGVKKLKASEEQIDFLPTKNFTSDELQIRSTIFSTSSDIVDGNHRTDDVPFGLPFTVQVSDSVAGCIFLQPSATTSLPNTPKGGHEFHRAFSALSAFSLPDPNENEVMTLNKYVDKRDIEKSTNLDSGTTNRNNMHLSLESKLSSQHAWSYTTLRGQPTEKPDTNQSSVDIHTQKSERLSRCYQQHSTGKVSRIGMPPDKGPSTRLQSMEEDTSPNLPIGIIKRKQDYLAGIASRDDIEVNSTALIRSKNKNNVESQLRIETTGSGYASIPIEKNVSDFQITDKVATLNLQTSRKTNVTEISKKSVQTDLSQTENSPPKSVFPHGMRPVYHYERYSPKASSGNQRSTFWDFMRIPPTSWHAQEASDVAKEINREMVLYSHAPLITPYGNPLAWWRTESSKFPHLASMARRYLAIPSTSAESERLFSTAGDIVNCETEFSAPGHSIASRFFISTNLKQS